MAEREQAIAEAKANLAKWQGISRVPEIERRTAEMERKKAEEQARVEAQRKAEEEAGITYGKPSYGNNETYYGVEVNGETIGQRTDFDNKGKSIFEMLVPFAEGTEINGKTVEGEFHSGQPIIRFESALEMAEFWKRNSERINYRWAEIEEEARLEAERKAEDISGLSDRKYSSVEGKTNGKTRFSVNEGAKEKLHQ